MIKTEDERKGYPSLEEKDAMKLLRRPLTDDECIFALVAWSSMFLVIGLAIRVFFF